jgi:hypothetical protein
MIQCSLALVLGLALSACGSPDNPAPAPEPTPPTFAPQQGETACLTAYRECLEGVVRKYPADKMQPHVDKCTRQLNACEEGDAQ